MIFFSSNSVQAYYTPLQKACYKGGFEAVQILLGQSGISLDAREGMYIIWDDSLRINSNIFVFARFELKYGHAGLFPICFLFCIDCYSNSWE